MDQIHQTETIEMRNSTGELREKILRKLFIYLTTRDIITCREQGFPNSLMFILQTTHR